jgi:hypothetical protein
VVHYRILPEQRLIVLCLWGVTPVEEVLKLSQNMRSNPDFSQSYDVIVDNTHLERQYTSEEIRRLAATRSKTKGSPPIKVATIAPADLAYGMSRMYQMIADDDENPVEMRVFRDTSSALTWLGRVGIEIECIFEEIREEATEGM